MKKTACFILLICFIFIQVSCNNQKCCDGPPLPLTFEVLDKSGNSLISSPKDSVFVTFNDANNNFHKSLLEIRNLYSNPADTTSNVLNKYNGLFITDSYHTNISLYGLSSPNSIYSPIHNFNLYINGVKVGVINLNYPSTRSVVFNNNTASIDTSLGYYKMNLLK